MTLEATSVGYEEYRKTANAENLKLVLDTIKLTQEMGKNRYKNIKLETVAQIQKDVDQIYNEGIKSINQEEADTFFGKVKQGIKNVHYIFISDNRKRLAAL